LNDLCASQNIAQPISSNFQALPSGSRICAAKRLSLMIMPQRGSTSRSHLTCTGPLAGSPLQPARVPPMAGQGAADAEQRCKTRRKADCRQSCAKMTSIHGGDS